LIHSLFKICDTKYQLLNYWQLWMMTCFLPDDDLLLRALSELFSFVYVSLSPSPFADRADCFFAKDCLDRLLLLLATWDVLCEQGMLQRSWIDCSVLLAGIVPFLIA